MTYYVFSVFIGYSLLVIGIWGIAAIAVNAIWKSRPKLDTSKRQKKLFIHTITPKGEKVK